MRWLAPGALALAALSGAPAAAQTAPAPVAQAPEPARLAAAKALIARIMPPERIDTMIDQMMRPMSANLREAMLQAPDLQSALREHPEAAKTLDRFVEDEFARSIAMTKEAMPALTEAMARAYARRFTAPQLGEIGAFFDTPTGKLYAEQAATIMADPDILAAQRAMMTKAVQGMMQRAQAMATTLAEEAEQEKK